MFKITAAEKQLILKRRKTKSAKYNSDKDPEIIGEVQAFGKKLLKTLDPVVKLERSSRNLIHRRLDDGSNLQKALILFDSLIDRAYDIADALSENEVEGERWLKGITIKPN